MEKVMQIALTLIIFVGGILSPALAKTVSLEWDPNTDQKLAGYKIYYSTNASAPFEGLDSYQGPSPIDVGNITSFAVSGLSDNVKHYFTVTAYDSSGYESGYSNVVASNSIIPELDSTWSASEGIMLSSSNLITKDVNAPTELNIRKYEGVVVRGEVSCINLDAHFTGDTVLYVFAKDQDTGDIISSEDAIFINSEYSSYEACVVYHRSATNVDLHIEFGGNVGTYQFQKLVVSTSLPVTPPTEDFWLNQIVKPSITGSVYDDVWSWKQPIPFPDKYRLIIAKTLKGIKGKEPEALYADININNVGQIKFTLSLTGALEKDGYFVSLRSIKDGLESVPVIKAHLPGNIVGTTDDTSPRRFKNIAIDTLDISTAYDFYMKRAIVPAATNQPASPQDRASRFNFTSIIRNDYLYTNGRKDKKLLIKLP